MRTAALEVSRSHFDSRWDLHTESRPSSSPGGRAISTALQALSSTIRSTT